MNCFSCGRVLTEADGPLNRLMHVPIGVCLICAKKLLREICSVKPHKDLGIWRKLILQKTKSDFDELLALWKLAL